MAKIKIHHPNSSHKTKPRGTPKRAFERVYWPYIPIVIVISFLLAVGGRSGSLAAYLHHPASRVLAYATSMSVSGLLTDTNAQRTANGVANLTLNDKLIAAAQAKANDMAARDYWSHYTPDGDPPWIFVTNQGYAYQKLGENLATGFSDEQSTINGWMASPPHRENLLDPAFSEVGFGFANSPDYTAAGGGPMTIIVAFYGQPQVLSAQTAPASTVSPAVPPPSASSTPAASPTPPASQAPPKQPATTVTPKNKIAPVANTTRLQLAAPRAPYGPTVVKLAVLLALGVAILWASRHLLVIRRFALQGEAFAIRHPLTDLGLFIIAGLLFILSQTAGLVQ